MKTLPLLLVLSLLGNAALTYAVLRSAAPRSSPSREPAAASAASAPTSHAAATSSNASMPAAPAPTLWSRVYSDDIEQLAARLKEAGFSAREISAIVLPRLAEKFSIVQSGLRRPYWQSDLPNYADPAIREAMRRNGAEQQRLYEKFSTPVDLATDPAAQESARRRFGNLPLEKLQALQQLEADYQQLALKTVLERRTHPGETVTGDPLAAQNLIEQEKLADLAKILTPEELAQYELRNGTIARQLKWQLRTFQPTEQEYLAIYAVQKKYAAVLNDPTKTPGQQSGVMADIGKELAAILGPERAEDYAASTTTPSDETAILVQRLGLPARIAPQVRTLQRDFTTQAAAIRTNAQLSAADRAAQLSALAQQARAAVTAKLGAQGFEAYDDRKGEWIRALEKPAPGRP
ncbi:MAG: hypothetical protein HZA32_07140 [Opitutae bacterium]|nr:hypothetical protein [Opitutae bacterium]